MPSRGNHCSRDSGDLVPTKVAELTAIGPGVIWEMVVRDSVNSPMLQPMRGDSAHAPSAFFPGSDGIAAYPPPKLNGADLLEETEEQLQIDHFSRLPPLTANSVRATPDHDADQGRYRPPEFPSPRQAAAKAAGHDPDGGPDSLLLGRCRTAISHTTDRDHGAHAGLHPVQKLTDDKIIAKHLIKNRDHRDDEKRRQYRSQDCGQHPYDPRQFIADHDCPVYRDCSGADCAMAIRSSISFSSIQ